MGEPKTVVECIGLVQWTEASVYLDYAGLKPESATQLTKTDPQALMDSQLEFLMFTLETTDYKIKRWQTGNVQVYYNKLPLSDGISGAIEYEDFYQSERSPKDLALIFHACYERSDDTREMLEERAKAAGEWYTYFTGLIID